MNAAIQRLLTALALVATVILCGGLALWTLGGGRWSFGDGIYMAVISAATVGFSELPDFEKVPGARFVAAAVILLGIGAFAFFQSSLTAFFVEGAIGEAFRRKRMLRQIAELEDHVVVAGCGSTGLHVIEELVATHTPFVVIDRTRERIDKANADFAAGSILYVVGDATEDHTLAAAGIARASGVIAALTHDRDNLYVTLSARSLNAKARIVTKVVEPEAVPKMLRAGANATVSPNTIGGRRLASELLRPTVVEFLDVMLRDRERNLRFEEVVVPPDSHVVGRRLRDVPLRQETNALVVGFRGSDRQLQYNPTADLVLEAGAVLVVLAQADDMPRLRDFLARPARLAG